MNSPGNVISDDRKCETGNPKTTSIAKGSFKKTKKKENMVIYEWSAIT